MPILTTSWQVKYWNNKTTLFGYGRIIAPHMRERTWLHLWAEASLVLCMQTLHRTQHSCSILMIQPPRSDAVPILARPGHSSSSFQAQKNKHWKYHHQWELLLAPLAFAQHHPCTMGSEPSLSPEVMWCTSSWDKSWGTATFQRICPIVGLVLCGAWMLWNVFCVRNVRRQTLPEGVGVEQEEKSVVTLVVRRAYFQAYGTFLRTARNCWGWEWSRVVVRELYARQ